jgi:hypothetical protein
MAKKIWESEAVSIIVLPSGSQGEEILALAQEWSRSWLLTPALWMLADEIPTFEKNLSVDLQVPPNLNAYLLGRDAEQNSVKEQVDVFWTLGSQPFKKVRFIAVRTEQDVELMRRTSISAETAAEFIKRAIPLVGKGADRDLTGAYFNTYNLIISPTNERGIIDDVLSSFWDANLVAAAEDRATPLSTDSFVKTGERYIGFALAHIATTAGLWAGLPLSSAEINSEKVQMNQARLQRVFVRGVTSDTLSADVAHWALQKMNYADTNFDLGLVEGSGIKTISAEFQSMYMNRVVDYILAGPENGDKKDNFLYAPFESTKLSTKEPSRLKRFLLVLQDMADGLAGIPRWVGAGAAYRMDFALDEEADDDILYKALPKRLAPKIKLPPVDVLIASLKPKMEYPTPELWKHMRLAISSAIDAQPEEHPAVLTDLQDGSLLVFATIENVLPDPETSWSGQRYENQTSVRFGDVSWLDAAFSKEISSNIQARIDELEPGILDARNQLAETQRLVDEAVNEVKDVSDEISLIEVELERDEHDSKKSKGQHTHKLPRAVTEKAKRPSQGGKTGGKIKHTDPGVIIEINREIERTKEKGFFRRIFSRKGRS